jgi:hypothetical protein
MIGRSRSSCAAVLARSVGLALLVGVVALATAAPGALAHGAKTSAPTDRGNGLQRCRGIVQSISPRAIVVKQLDGSTRTVPVDARTRVLVDGRRATFLDVKPGFTAFAVWRSGRPAQEVRTFSLGPRPGPGSSKSPGPRPLPETGRRD